MLARYAGERCSFILYRRVSLCSCLLFSKVSQRISSYNDSMDTSRVAPVDIRAASIWILSTSSFSYWVQLSQTVSAYSNIGRINEMYIISRLFLSRRNFSFLIMLILRHALPVIYSICWCQVPSRLKYRPKCLWLSTSETIMLFINIGGCTS